MYSLKDVVNRAKDTGIVTFAPAYCFLASDPYEVAFTKLYQSTIILAGDVEYFGVNAIKVWVPYEEGYWIFQWSDKSAGVDTISFWSAQTVSLRD